MKIGIWFPNRLIEELDYSRPEVDNPGISGTGIEIALLISMFPNHSKRHELIQFTEVKSKIHSCTNIILKDVYSAVEKASELSIDCFITVAVNDSKLFQTINTFKLKTIFWGHNYYYYDMCINIVENEYIIANVFCGRQVYDRYIDHEIIEKSTFIYNMLGEAKTKRESMLKMVTKNPNITYIGAIIPSKGFHVLAQQWQKILDRFPDATLNVVGSGNLYGGKSNLGVLGLAQSNYENTFNKYITDSNGKLIKSVILHGIVAQDKKTEIISNTTVGIINPTGRTENCPVSAIDFQSHGVPVVTKYVNGSVDILLNNKTGIFYLFEKNLHKKIFKLITNRSKNDTYGKEAIHFFKNTFSTEVVLPRWEILFDELESKSTLEFIKPNSHFFNNFKFLRMVIRVIRFKLKIRVFPSLIQIETIIKTKIIND